MESIVRDIQYALRTLRRAPVFTVVAALTLALGIASTTTAFSVIDAVVLRGLPYRAPERLLGIYERNADGGLRTPSYPTFDDWRTQTAGTGAAEGFAFVRGNAVTLPGVGETNRQISAYVSPGFFTVMGARPMLGRTFLPDEERPGGANVAVISYDLFQRQFGGDVGAIGRTIDVDSVPTTIVGVMSRGFAYPNWGGSYWFPSQLWQPIALFEATHPAVLTLRGLHVDSRTVVRLRAGTDSARASAQVQAVERRLASAYPVEQAHWTSVSLQPLADELYGSIRPAVVLIAAAIGLVMLLACANVANLFLVRNSARARELAVRTAIGAGRWRLSRQLFVEALVLAVIAGALGVALSSVLVGFVRHSMGALLPFSSQLSVDARTLAFAVAASFLTAVVIGAAPAFGATAGALAQRIRSGGAGAAGSPRERRLRSSLVSVQFALAVTLLVGAGLLVQSFRRLALVSMGYDAHDVIAFTIGTSTHQYDAPAAAAGLYARILDAVRAVPSVQSAAAAGGALLETTVGRTDEPATGQPLVQAVYHPVSTDYLRTMRIPMLAGRWFNDEDMRAPAGLVVSDRLARTLWPGGDAIGKRITIKRQSQARADFGQPITLPVIGITADVREFGATEGLVREVYLPYTLEVWPWMNFVVRAPNADRVVKAVGGAVRATDSAIRFRGEPSVMQTGAASIDRERRFVTLVLAGFAAGALLLAAIGLYGIVAYGVMQRTREIGVRIALGASRRRVVALVVGDGAAFVLAGAVVGLLGAVASTRLIRSMLFETTATDAATFVVVPLVLAAVAMVAIYLPARRAAGTDPTIAIRTE